MERRGFLKGIFGGITAGGLLLKASPEDVQALAPAEDEPLIVQPQRIRGVHQACGDVLYNALGEAVAVVTDVRSSRGYIDVTNFGDTNKVFRPSNLPPTMTLTAKLLPTTTCEYTASVRSEWLSLRGRRV